MKARFNYPTRILFGEGVAADLPQELRALGVTRPLVCTDRGLARTSIPGRILELLRGAGLEAASFAEVSPNPGDLEVEAGTRAFREHRADSLVALGGGSPMDAAKAIQIRIHHKAPLETYDDLKGGDALITGELPPLVAIPTTAGTGSEVSRSAVITIAAVDRKVVLFSPRLMPRVALCDPELTYALPARLTAETGMDALSHSVEAYLARGFHPMADAIALSAIRMVAAYLPRAVADGGDREARAHLLMASTMGAVAFQKGLGVIHSLAHPLSSVAHVGHGLANAILMPHALRFNAVPVPERVAAVAEALGAFDRTGEGAAQAVLALLDRLGLPQRLGDVGVVEAVFPKLVERALEDGCHASNPRPCAASDMQALLRSAL